MGVVCWGWVVKAGGAEDVDVEEEDMVWGWAVGVDVGGVKRGAAGGGRDVKGGGECA